MTNLCFGKRFSTGVWGLVNNFPTHTLTAAPTVASSQMYSRIKSTETQGRCGQAPLFLWITPCFLPCKSESWQSNSLPWCGRSYSNLCVTNGKKKNISHCDLNDSSWDCTVTVEPIFLSLFKQGVKFPLIHSVASADVNSVSEIQTEWHFGHLEWKHIFLSTLQVTTDSTLTAVSEWKWQALPVFTHGFSFS